MNVFQGLIHQETSLEVPFADEVLALFLLGSLPDTWETLVVTLGTTGPEGKRLSLARVESSLLDEETRRKDKDTSSDSKALLTESERGRQRNRSPQNREKSGTRSKSRGRPTCFFCGNRNTSRRIVGTSEKTRKLTILIQSGHWTEMVKTEGGRTGRERQQSCCSSPRRVS